MKRPPSQTLWANGGCLLVLAWLYGGDLADGLRARTAEVSAFPALPSVGWPACVLAATGVGLGVLVWGLVRGRGGDFKGYRLLPILLVCALFVDLVLAEGQLPLRSGDLSVLALEQVQEKAQALSDGRTVPADPAVLRSLLEGLEPPPYLVRGTRAAGWSLQVREGCDGPVLEAPGLEVGTFLYCVGPERRSAWVTLVALPWGERFGEPSIFSMSGRPYALVVEPPPPPEAEPEPGAGGLFLEAREPHAPSAPEAAPGPGAGVPAPTP